MAITKQRKQELMQQYEQWLDKSKGLILAEYTGMTVKEVDALRLKMREVGAEFHIVKNTLGRKALAQAGMEFPAGHMDGSTAIVFAFQDPPAVAKAITEFARTSDFKSHLESSSGQDLTWYFEDWFTGEGYPTYNVHIAQDQDYSASVTINQSQSHNSVSFFELPVAIQFIGAGKDTTILFNNTFSGQVFTINPGFAIDSTVFDPDLRLISRNNTITVGVDDLPAGKELKLMPNPVSDILFVRHDPGKINSIEVMNMDGEKVSVNIYGQNETGIRINVQNLKSGIYLLRIGYDERFATSKFVKE